MYTHRTTDLRTLYEPGDMQSGMGQFKCFTVLPDSCLRKSVLLETVKFTPSWEDTRYISSES